MDPVQKMVEWIKRNQPGSLRFDTKWIVEGIRHLLSGGRLGTTIVMLPEEILDFRESEREFLYRFFFGVELEEVIAEFEKYL